MKEDLQAQARQPDAEAVRRHAQWHGKIQVMPKSELRGPGDFAVWYTPGVAAPCRASTISDEMALAAAGELARGRCRRSGREPCGEVIARGTGIPFLGQKLTQRHGPQTTGQHE